MIFRGIQKCYYFIYYCNFKIMDNIAAKNMKNSPIHGWTWPMFIFGFNLMTVESLLNLTAHINEYNNYIFIFYFILV